MNGVKQKDQFKKDALLEIGCEELPADYMLANEQTRLAFNTEQVFRAKNLDFDEVKVQATPRRIIFYIRGLAEDQTSITRELAGPKKSIAYLPDGTLSPAGQGFLRKAGVKPEEIGIQDERLFVRLEVKGQPTRVLLPEIFSELIRGKFDFPKTMRWEASGARFARPIRWITALFGTEVIPFHCADIEAGRITRLHPLHRPQQAEVPSASEHENILRQGRVINTTDKRFNKIKEALEAEARRLGGCPVKDSGLLETVTMMAEFPGVLSGNISKNFLDLPREIIITTLREHQRYFAVEDESGRLLPFFLAVHDNPLAAADTMRPGFERVLEARLKDAEFFYNQDVKNSLEQKVPDLERVLWIKGLGSLRDKTQRLENLCARLAKKLEPGQEENVQQAAHLSKADLISLMVQEKEFSSLQGIMGTCYALAQGVPEAAALAIREQYLPRWSDDKLPATPAGRILALVDKLDHMAGCWGAGFIPTGTKDPYALRRAAQGIIAITLEVGYKYSLNEVLDLSVRGFGSFSEKAEEIKTGIKTYIQGRMESELGRRGIKPDLIQALLGVWWDDITILVQKAETLHALRNEPGFTEKIITFSRVVNILPKDMPRNIPPDQEEKEVNTRIFSHETEKQLHTACQKAGKEIADLSRAGNFRACFERLAEMKPLIDRFFDDVMVMDKNEDIRRNRLNLLTNLARQIWILADFSRLAA